MGNILATPQNTNYRRTLSGANRVKAIRQLDNESTDLFYVLYIYFTVILLVCAVIYLYSIRAEGVPRFKGDTQPGQESWWQRFINWLQETPADRRCYKMNSYPTISVPLENQPSATANNGLCSPGENGTSKPDSDCIQ